jgi:leucyl aminopeptidase
MKITIDFEGKNYAQTELKILGAFQKSDKDKKSFQLSWTSKENIQKFQSTKNSQTFTGGKGEVTCFTGNHHELIKIYGLGDKTKIKGESLRREAGKIFKSIKGEKVKKIGVDISSFNSTDKLQTATIFHEAFMLAHYSFDKYLSTKSNMAVEEIIFYVDDKKVKTKLESAIHYNNTLSNSINVIRDFINEAPNVLHSEAYADLIEEDVKKNLKGVKVKILNKAQIQKENMNLFLSVNAGSHYEPRFVHLSYTPKKVSKNTKHIALVGKGITFDTGGYSLKPAANMTSMKYDMGGSATVYGAFRAAVMLGAPVKLDCILVITDNAVNSLATKPDAIVKGRNGVTVEILNTDAEGRLILADALDYACDLKPHAIIDAATLTGACLVALGNQVCAVLGNDDKLINQIKKSADATGEYMWQLPIIQEWRDDIKSKVADIKNIGSPMRAGTAIGAAFLERFIKNDVAWAHLDIAGVCDSQSHLSYCPDQGASGLIVRTLTHYILNG